VSEGGGAKVAGRDLRPAHIFAIGTQSALSHFYRHYRLAIGIVSCYYRHYRHKIGTKTSIAANKYYQCNQSALFIIA
jgi:hypothetical protein